MQAEQDPFVTHRFPSDVIGVAVMEQGASEPSQTWENLLQEVIEKQGYKAAPRLFHGRGAAAGGPENLLHLLRAAFEIGGYLSSAIAAEQFMRRRRSRRQDERVAGGDKGPFTDECG